MKKPLLIFALKCSVIFYFAACTGINEFTQSVAASPKITKGKWKVNLFTNSQKDETATFSGCEIAFLTSGKIIVIKNGEKYTGNWAEDEISKRITINLQTNDPSLAKLNSYWEISKISKKGLSFKNAESNKQADLQIGLL